MKPTISIFEDEIVITTDSFDLILKTGAERKAQRAERETIGSNPFIDEGQVDWDNDPFAPSVHSLEQAIDEYKEQHPEQFAPVVEPVTTGNIAKRTRNLPAKPCMVCGNDFKPTWNTQRYCPACKPKTGKRKPLAEQSAEELEKTLQEIENRRKKPYEFK
jgi:hypothetical protein